MNYFENVKAVLRSFNNPLKKTENLTLKDDLEQKFYDQEAESHLEKFDPKLYAFDENEVMPATHTYFYSLLTNVKDSRVLDICCGYGFTSVLLAKRGADVTSIDISPKMIELTEKNAAFNNVQNSIDAKKMSVQAMTFDDNSFDFVVGFGAVHHLNIELAGREISRVLKKGGRAIFIEPRIPLRLLILLRSALPIKCLESPGGSQLTDNDIFRFSSYFSSHQIEYFVFLKKLSRLPILRKYGERLDEIDRRLVCKFPWLRKFYWAFVLDFKK